MAFGFHAEFVHSDDLVLRLSFADRDGEKGQHYFIMDRSENSPEAVPEMENIYIERDDQCWGGYGGIARVILEQNSLTVHLEPRMARRMGQHDEIRVTFILKDNEFHQLQCVVQGIMRGYESRLECRS